MICTMVKDTMASSPSSLPWTERMHMVPLHDDSTTSTTSASPSISNNSNSAHRPLEFNIASFNTLAESYLTPRSHPGLPPNYASVAFDPTKRQQLLLDTLRKFACPASNPSKQWSQQTKWDIICLQELEILPEGQDLLLPAFESWGYQVVRTPNDQRVDGSAIVFDATKFRLVDSKVVRFDDLASLTTLTSSQIMEADIVSTPATSGNDIVDDKQKEEAASPSCKNKKKSKKASSSPTELAGMVRSFLRRNCAIVAHLESIDPTTTSSTNKENNDQKQQTATTSSPQQFIVVSAHLYWHPGYEYVKLCQAKYLLERVHSMARNATVNSKSHRGNTNSRSSDINNENRIPVIICGDMNSKSGSIVHQLFVTPHVDARQVAPWHYFYNREDEVLYQTEKDETNSGMEDRRDGQDPVVLDVEESTLPESNVSENELLYGNDSNNNGAELASASTDTGYQVYGLPSEFSTYCTVLDSDKPTMISTTKTSETSKKLENRDNDNGNENNVRSFGVEMNDAEAALASRRLSKHVSPQDYQHSTPPMPVKYMLDYTLNRFTRWLRILGIDATLETEEEEKERTRTNGNIAIFDHCKKEHRTLITTSYKLLLRKDCPPGAYHLDPKSTSHLEQALVRMLRTHGVQLAPCVFLTRCVVCNGNINRVLADEEKRKVFIEHGAPDLVDSKNDMEVFRCDGCRQGYWWDDRPSSSASRVFMQATKLFRLCLRGGVGLKDETSKDEKKRKEVVGAFDFVDVQMERQQPIENDLGNIEDELCAVKWLREEELSNPFDLKSSYALPDNGGEELPFSNVTLEFVGLLDYVFFDSCMFEQVGKLHVPTSFREMNTDGIPKGHLLPSDIWPSDHLAVGARLRLKSVSAENIAEKVAKSTQMDAKSDTADALTKPVASSAGLPAHAARCACGCVPQIFSLFEMAELRKKAREAAKAQAAATLSK